MLHSSALLMKINKLFERHKPPKFIQEETNKWNSFISTKEKEFIAEKLDREKISGSSDFIDMFYQTFKECQFYIISFRN